MRNAQLTSAADLRSAAGLWLALSSVLGGLSACGVFALALFSASPLQAAYTFYSIDQLTGSNSNWTPNGSLSYLSNGNGVTSASAGSLISNITPPTNPNDYEVYANVWLNASRGNYGFLLRASANALPPNQGSFYMFELQNPQFSGGSCTATFAMSKTVNGVSTQLASSSTWCTPLVQFRVVMHGSSFLVYQRGSTTNSEPVNAVWQLLVWSADSDLTTGKPGISVRNAPANNSINWVNLDPTDAIAPNPIDRNNLATTSISNPITMQNRIDMQWKGASDIPDSNGNATGIALYIVYRDGYPVPYSYFFDSTGGYSDTSVTAGKTYSYDIRACDYHGNCADLTFSATAAASGSVDPRRVGLRPTSVNWGGGGENIDIFSGNLNFTLPLLTAKGRGGISAGISMNYNSQNWRQDVSGTWNYGRDIGYGYGFRVMAGSIQKYYNASWAIDRWTFTDSTGAEYRLGNEVLQDGVTPSSTSGIWASNTDSTPMMYDSNTNRLYFPSGMFWQFDCASTGNEGDDAARYPTLIQDTNGNQILIRYKPGLAAIDGSGNPIYVAWPNSSGRIDQIEDVRAVETQVGGPYWTYQFNYDSLALPHLMNITNSIQTAEGYQFTYNSGAGNLGVALTSPWGLASGTTWQLAGIMISGVNLSYGLTYDATGSSSLSKVAFPYGGYIRWNYADGSYSGSRKQREVLQRYTSADGEFDHLIWPTLIVRFGPPGQPRMTRFRDGQENQSGTIRRAPARLRGRGDYQEPGSQTRHPSPDGAAGDQQRDPAGTQTR